MPQDILADGRVKICIDTSLNYIDGGCRILIEGQYVANALLAEPVVPDVPMRITGTRDIDTLFGAGSVLAESLKKAFVACRSDAGLSSIELWALPRLDNTTTIAPVNAVWTIDVANAATTSETIPVAIGPLVANVTVTAGDSAATIAANLAALLPTSGPFTVAVAGAQLVLTWNSPGASGNQLTAGVQTAPTATTTFTTAQTMVGAGSDKALYSMTFTGPATSDGKVDIFLGDGDYSVEFVLVDNGDTAATIAAAVAAAIPSNFPYKVTYISGDATILFESISSGTVGNWFNPLYNWKGYRAYAPTGVAMTVAQLVTGAVDPLPINYASAIGDCCFSVFALLGQDETWQRGLRDYIRTLWDCATPQCFGHGYTYNTGSLGTVLAAGDNSPELSRLAVSTDNEPNFPWMLIANYAALTACTACSNPELNIQGRTAGVLSTITRPQSCTLGWSYDERTQLMENQFVVHGPLSLGSGLLTYPYIYNDVTNYMYDEMGRPNLTYRDASSRRLAAKTAIAVATQLQTYAGPSVYTKNTRIPAGVYGINKRMILADMQRWFKSQVGILFSEPDNLEEELTLVEDFEVAAPCRGVPCRFIMSMLYRPPCRTAQFDVTLRPKYLDNCSRA